MNVVILAPHQDDEILSSYLYMQRLISQGDTVSVVFATNGDYAGRTIAALRAKESIQVLSKLAITEKDVYFMGYADTGMCSMHSFLLKLYNCPAAKVCASKWSSKTYHPLGDITVHNLLYGKQASYTRSHFLNDLDAILQYLHTQILIAPSQYDYHGDHRALGLFVTELIKQGTLKIPVYSYLIHTGNDLLWPDRDTNEFHRPDCISQELWQTRIIHTFTQKVASGKLKIIQSFVSQCPLDLNWFLLSFAKKQEFYLLENIILSL